MVKRCIEELGVDPKRFPPRAVRAQISGAKNQLLDAEAYSPRRRRGGRGRAATSSETVADVYQLYERRMLEANAMDFDDLLVRTVNLLELFEDVRERYRRAFRWVLVDEYQDTNRAQYRLLQLLVRGARQPVRGRRRLPVDLLVQERGHPQHPRVRARLRRARRWSSSSRTTAPPRPSSTPPTGSSPTTAARSRSASGPTRAGASR